MSQDTASKGIVHNEMCWQKLFVLTGLVSPPPTTRIGLSVTLHLSALSTVIAKAALEYATEFYMSVTP